MKVALFRRLSCAFALACACALLALPTTAQAIQAPTDDLDEAYAWAESYLAGMEQQDTLDLLSTDGAAGFELLALDEGGFDLQAVTVDTSWYTSGASRYTLSSGSHLAGLAKLVNDGTDFKGKAITLSRDIVFVGAEVTSIGGANGRAFDGTLDGAGHSIRSFKITSTGDSGRAQNIGLVGAAGPSSTIKNITISGATITVKRSAKSTQAVSAVGALVGHTQGSLENCAVDATIDVDVATPQTTAVTSVIAKIGGVAGVAFGDVTDCSFAGSISTYTDTAGSDATDQYNRQVGLVVAQDIGGVVGYAGDPAAHESPDASTHGTIRGCAFSGTLNAQSPSEAGLDRFGEVVSAKTACVGGIVGYTQGSVLDSTCSGVVYAPQGTLTGGIAGSLRCESVSGIGDTSTHDSGSASDEIEAKRCRTTASAKITGLHGGGGIVGGSGSYTLVTECLNAGDVTVMRWNKPAGGGIAGQSHGKVSFCGNIGTVATATGGGYYVAGVVGMLLAYTTANGTPTTPTPEVWGCYNAGVVDSMRGMKSAGLVGENDGYLHDSVFLQGTCIDGEVYQVNDSSAGSYTNCLYLTQAQMKSKEALAALNALRPAAGWDNYFVLRAGAMNGYPTLLSFAPDATPTQLSLSGMTAAVAADAAYTGGEAIPTLDVTFNGTRLVQNADFYVVPQAGATQLGGGYRAGIVGIGDYTGRVEGVSTYAIAKGDLADCTVTIASKKFDYERKALSPDDVVVTDSYGNVLPSSWYTFAFCTAPYTGKDTTYQGQTLPVRYLGPTDTSNMSNIAPEWSVGGPIHYGYYPVTVTATASGNYTGSVEGRFKVTPASIMSDCEIDGMIWDGKTYAWNNTTTGTSTFVDGTPVIAYTGSAIQPTVGKVTYLGHELTEGVDYRIVWGNPNSDTDSSNYLDSNTGRDDADTVACTTVRFIGGGKPYDFDNYVNMYFVIHGSKAAATPSIETCRVSAPDQFATGSEISPVRVRDAAGRDVPSQNYTVVYENNREPGTATFTVYGTRGYTGKVTGSFAIYPAEDALGFTDVAAGAWYLTGGAVRYAVENNLLNGYKNTTRFGPNDPLSRAMAVTILWRFACPEEYAAYNEASARNATDMPDVKNGTWYTQAANWASENGILTGYTRADGSHYFDPDRAITREQMCAIVARYAAYMNGADLSQAPDGAAKLAGLPDGSKVSPYAREAVVWALDKQVVNGKRQADGTYRLDPSAGLTRAEMAQIMLNATGQEEPVITPSSTRAEVALTEANDAASDTDASRADAALDGKSLNQAAEATASEEPTPLPSDDEALEDPHGTADDEGVAQPVEDAEAPDPADDAGAAEDNEAASNDADVQSPDGEEA